MQRSWAFRTDNSGPPMNADEVFKQFDIARWQFQGANVYASTYDNFTAQVGVMGGETRRRTTTSRRRWG